MGVRDAAQRAYVFTMASNTAWASRDTPTPICDARSSAFCSAAASFASSARRLMLGRGAVASATSLPGPRCCEGFGGANSSGHRLTKGDTRQGTRIGNPHLQPGDGTVANETQVGLGEGVVQVLACFHERVTTATAEPETNAGACRVKGSLRRAGVERQQRSAVTTTLNERTCTGSRSWRECRAMRQCTSAQGTSNAGGKNAPKTGDGAGQEVRQGRCARRVGRI